MTVPPLTDSRLSLVRAIAAYDREVAHPDIYDDLRDDD